MFRTSEPESCCSIPKLYSIAYGILFRGLAPKSTNGCSGLKNDEYSGRLLKYVVGNPWFNPCTETPTPFGHEMRGSCASCTSVLLWSSKTANADRMTVLEVAR